MSPSSFHRWRSVLAAGGPSSRRLDDRPTFVELEAPSSTSGPAVVVALAGGRRIEVASGADEAWVARLIDQLDRMRDEAAA